MVPAEDRLQKRRQQFHNWLFYDGIPIEDDVRAQFIRRQYPTGLVCLEISRGFEDDQARLFKSDRLDGEMQFVWQPAPRYSGDAGANSRLINFVQQLD